MERFWFPTSAVGARDLCRSLLLRCSAFLPPSSYPPGEDLHGSLPGLGALVILILLLMVAQATGLLFLSPPYRCRDLLAVDACLI
jgi:hypothetical protein